MCNGAVENTKNIPSGVLVSSRGLFPKISEWTMAISGERSTNSVE